MTAPDVPPAGPNTTPPGAAPTSKPRPVALDLLPTATGKRYVKVTSGGPGPADLVSELPTSLLCLRRECLDAARGNTCAHVAAARAFLAEIDADTSADAPASGEARRAA